MSLETPPTELQEEDVQARLMRMLDSVRLERPADAPGDEQIAAPIGCSHCGSQASWGTASWCPDCGYYPKLGRAVTPVEAAQAAPKTLKDFQWAIILGGGVLALLVASICIRLSVADAPSRSQWAICQILLGLTLLCIAQVQAYLVASGSVGAITLGSLFFEPAKLWAPVLKSLPGNQRTLHLGVWSLSAMILAVAVVGIDFNSVFGSTASQRKPVNPMKTIMKVAGAAADSQTAFSDGGGDGEGGIDETGQPGDGPSAGGGNPNMSMEEAVNGFAGGAGVSNLTSTSRAGAKPGKELSAGELKNAVEDALNSKAIEEVPEPTAAKFASLQQPPEESEPEVPLTASGEVRNDRSEFIVFGYLTNGGGELRSILLADVRNEKLRFASKLPIDELTADRRRQLQLLLDSRRAKLQTIDAPYHARWVQPVVKVRIAHVGWTTSGELKEGFLVTFEDLSSLVHR